MPDDPDHDNGSLDDTIRGHESLGDAPTAAVGATIAGIGGTMAAGAVPHLPRARPSMPPTTERYTIGAQIGKGGMGEVVGAFDETIGRDVAVKRILATEPSSDELSRFLREARVQGRLEHPAIVPVHDLGFDASGRPYFVMKRLAGEAMSDILKRMKAGEGDVAAARRKLLRAFVDVCMAIELAHIRKIVHRDLKPANIMLGDFGEVYVLDWGVARVVDDTVEGGHGGRPHGPPAEDLDSGMTRAGAILGTPAYMAPEQLAGDAATPAADVYSLGCVLFEIVANDALYARTRTAGSLVVAVDARPSSRRADAPPELDVICTRATALDPAQRYPSARTLAEAVQAFLDGDRDIAVRRELAAVHLHRAQEALRSDSRSEAMREAGRALALDPESADAAMLVTQLMLQPPTHTPPEVEARLVELDTEAARFQGRLAAFSMIGYLGFVPFMLWSGVKQPWIIVAFTALTIVCGVQVYALSRSREIKTTGIYLSAILNAGLIALSARMVGPFMIAPVLVATTLMAYAVHPKFGRIWIVAAIVGSGMAIPWILETIGVLDSTFRFEHGAIVTSSPAITLTSLPVQVAFGAFLISVLAIVALLARTLAKRQRDVARRMELQAWQLRQLVPAKG